jgi:hypothetical protein
MDLKRKCDKCVPRYLFCSHPLFGIVKFLKSQHYSVQHTQRGHLLPGHTQYGRVLRRRAESMTADRHDRYWQEHIGDKTYRRQMVSLATKRIRGKTYRLIKKKHRQ